MSALRQYELVYVLSPEASEAEVADLHAQVEAIVARYDGHIDNTEHWGRRKLAYPISRHREGIYVLEVISGSGDLIKELDRRLKVIDQVIRHLVVRVDEALQVAERCKAGRKAHTERRRAARGLPPEADAAEGRGGERAPHEGAESGSAGRAEAES